eukprot:516201-Prymnesium_polylepis.1
MPVVRTSESSAQWKVRCHSKPSKATLSVGSAVHASDGSVARRTSGGWSSPPCGSTSRWTLLLGRWPWLGASAGTEGVMAPCVDDSAGDPPTSAPAHRQSAAERIAAAAALVWSRIPKERRHRVVPRRKLPTWPRAWKVTVLAT